MTSTRAPPPLLSLFAITQGQTTGTPIAALSGSLGNLLSQHTGGTKTRCLHKLPEVANDRRRQTSPRWLPARQLYPSRSCAPRTGGGRAAGNWECSILWHVDSRFALMGGFGVLYWTQDDLFLFCCRHYEKCQKTLSMHRVSFISVSTPAAAEVCWGGINV